ncbi:ester cyclase [Cognatishimia maritima]|uniref:Predicted ester cyclase n=1 Tax=Cognatishimia maritima TaxID=870908 RepID=A0A1M5NXP9_9RHOB|nr:ester cyclase [Cognatishimia maritima]SHG94290.1 Predicted ester cyclase [Cognatishimia maritima]
MDRHNQHKALLAPLRGALYDFEPKQVQAAMTDVMAADAIVHMCHPFGDVIGPDAFYQSAFAGLSAAWPDVERRDYIVAAGPDINGADWVGCAGYYTGTFLAPWLDIPATGHQVAMRFHEFYRFENGKVVEVQAIWDIPEVMLQASAWPMAPSLGREWLAPAPALQNGLVSAPRNEAESAASCQLILDMLTHLVRYPSQGGPEVMELDRFWHPKMSWYGPAGIGTARGVAGFRNWHQIPFLNAMPDRGLYSDDVTHHFFGDGPFAAVTGWPDMAQTHSADGWLGLPPTGKKITLRSLDFWRVENGKIRENWVLVDLLDVYRQLGVDVFARMREFNKARYVGPLNVPTGMEE